MNSKKLLKMYLTSNNTHGAYKRYKKKVAKSISTMVIMVTLFAMMLSSLMIGLVTAQDLDIETQDDFALMENEADDEIDDSEILDLEVFQDLNTLSEPMEIPLFADDFIPDDESVANNEPKLPKVNGDFVVSGDLDGGFDSLELAVAAVNNNGAGTYTIKVGRDEDLSDLLSIDEGRNVTLSSDGTTRTVTQAGSFRHFSVSGKLTVTDIILVGNKSGGGALVQDNGSFTIGSGVVMQNCFPKTDGGGHVSVIGGSFGMSGNAKIYGVVRVTDGRIDIRDNASILSSGKVAFYLKGSNVSGTISGGFFEATENALYMIDGAGLDVISGGKFVGAENAVYLEGKGTKIRLISGGTFFQNDPDVPRHGHGIFLEAGSEIGKISGGHFEAIRGAGLIIVRGSWVGEISGGEFKANRMGSTGQNNRNAAIRIDGDAGHTTGIGTISGGLFRGTNFGILSISTKGDSRINYISGGTFFGEIALQNDKGSSIVEISGGTMKATQHAFVNVGKVDRIGGNVDISTNGLYSIYNYPAGTIGEIYGGSFVSDSFHSISNAGSIDLISGGTIIGGLAAIMCSSTNVGKIGSITGGVFWGKDNKAFLLARDLLLEPDLITIKGNARFWGKDGVIFNYEEHVEFPGEYYMSTRTEPVVGIKDGQFKFLTLGDEVVYDANGGEGFVVDVNSPYFSDSTVTVLDQGDISRDGYTFLGWALSPDGSVEYVADQSFVINSDVVTLFAVWQQDEIPVVPPVEPPVEPVVPPVEPPVVPVVPPVVPAEPPVVPAEPPVVPAEPPVVPAEPPVVPAEPPVVPPVEPPVVDPSTAEPQPAEPPPAAPPAAPSAVVPPPIVTPDVEIPPSSPMDPDQKFEIPDIDNSNIESPDTTHNTNPEHNIVDVIRDINETPLAAPPDASHFVWALLNLILAVMGFILVIISGIRLFIQYRNKHNDERSVEDGETQKKLRITALVTVFVAGIAGIVLFFLTEDMRLLMVLADKWTIVNAIIFTLGIAGYMFLFKRDDEYDDGYNEYYKNFTINN
ncbi:MAG: InlB B-repeat-containing protein [Oscillospiraceae bacterium]|nr:InlB B-repeat-containing protein [Oscillospiraceae bacterium]